jgi:hypothetical protein
MRVRFPCRWHHQVMLRSVEIRTILSDVARGGELFHALHFLPEVELSLDCFICQRTGRTTILNIGAEQALCTADEEHGRHPTAARVAAFDTTTEDTQLSLRAVIDYWWAPFHDAKRDTEAAPISDPAWVRLHFGSYCRTHSQAGKHSTQTNLIRPSTTHCRHCDTPIATSNEAPTIRVLN